MKIGFLLTSEFYDTIRKARNNFFDEPLLLLSNGENKHNAFTAFSPLFKEIFKDSLRDINYETIPSH